MKNRAKWNNTNGFTLLEMMVTVVVIVVLSALAMIPISKMQKDIRQTELDSRAEMIFTAVQNRMTRLQAAGQSDVYESDREGVKELTSDSVSAEDNEQRTLVYVTSDSKDTPDSAAAWLYPETEAEAELWNANWVVEYDAKGGSVYAVFYSKESLSAYSAEQLDNLRSRPRRLENGAVVGYYGGDSVGAADTDSLRLTVEVIDQEKLLVRAVCKSVGRMRPTFRATVSDESGHTAEFEIKGTAGAAGSADKIDVNGKTYTVTLVLDDLSEGKRFGEQDRFKDLVPGENLTVKIRADVPDNLILGAEETVSNINSLFAEVRENGTGRTAVIKYGRHLQNLELEKSGLKKEKDQKKIITAAVQERDISFGASSSWAHEYDDRKFTPIENAQLKSYDSTNGTYHPAIYDLTVNTTGDTTGDAGLFKTFAGELKNIRLVDAKITGKGTVGGLVGKLTGETTIDGCQVYLKNVKKGLDKDKIFDEHTRIGGTVAGGLVGSTAGKTLTIQKSLAATVIRGGAYAGGLIGNGEGTLTVEGSYADCYISSNGKTGGLIGQRDVATAPLKITDCYTAGFLEGKETAGLVVCDLSGNILRNVYSACATLKGESLTYGTAHKTSGTSGNDNITNVYYLSETKDEKDTIGDRKSYQELSAPNAVTDLLSADFTKQNGDTHAYNLMSGLGLSQYSYPRLANLPHYGDWQAKFEDKALVYYEWYGETDYGFFGANISALSDKTVKGDGYGVVYEDDKPTTDVTVTVGGTEHTLGKDTAITITVTDKAGTKKTYYLLPLPAKLVQGVDGVPQVDGKPSFYTKLTAGGKDYYYNPHFASTAVTDGTEKPTQISIRTARQLYALSEYYDTYREILPKETVFRQECGIDYGTYDWANYGKGGKPVKEQKPIGQTKDAPFKHSYDGGEHIITGVSFASEKNDAAVGLFGFVTGTLEDIVVTTAEPLKTAPTAKLGGSVQRRTVYIGVLAGKNSGTIRNCAVSGYKLSCYAYSGSTCYIGGLVGYNEGTVSACSAAIPSISGNTTNARGYYAGALAGVNAGGGYIRQSYALGSIELREIRGSAVISGFVGDNQGTIRSSYCATALSAVTGAEVNGFASAHGSVSNCYYLSGGTYTFAGTVRLYDYEPGASGALPKTHEEMKELKLSGFSKVDETETKNHPNTEVAEGTKAAYPYPGSVSGQGETVHYGDWPTPADMGTVGMIYWEYEEGGANSGYHFSYIGFDAKGFRKEGSSLCTAHDDGGRITAYGYGYYEKEKTGKVTPKPSEDTQEPGNTLKLEGKRTDVADALGKQVSGYTFTCYQTGVDGLRMKSSTDANGTWKLTQNGQEHTYAVCPFFGDSYCPVEDVDNDAQNLGKEDVAKKKPYQIRSVEQLQFINWSYSGGSTGSVSTDVTKDTYQNFPYLQYATVTGKGQQERADAEKHRPQRSWTQTHDLNGEMKAKENKPFHPIAGAVEAKTKKDCEKYNLTLYNWFGGVYDGQSYYIKNIAINSYCYNVGLFGTTAGATIKNIVLYSDNGSVIQRTSKPTTKELYKKDRAESEPQKYATSYALGGLVGIAYDYQDKLGTSTIENCAIAGYSVQDNSKNKQALGEAAVGGLIGVSSVNLRNCSAVVDIAINCTHFWDRTQALNAAAYGNYVRVGGLVGGLRYRAANCYTGGSIRVSDDTLSERVLYKDDKLTELVRVDRTQPDHGNKEVRIKWSPNNLGYDNNPATYVFVGGVGGSGFSANFTNFTNAENSSDGQPYYENCYTYIDLPDMEGTITAISIIGSVADRHGSNTAAALTVKNCYYLDSTANISFEYAAKYFAYEETFPWFPWSQPDKVSLWKLLQDPSSPDSAANREAMLQGDLRFLSRHLWNKTGERNSAKELMWNIESPTPLTYEQMSNQIGGEGFIKVQNGSAAEYTTFRLALNKNEKNGPFGWVTNVENGSTIHGKYSFPGGDTALQGQDYPFPTVLTQTDSLGNKVNLHYGAWPKVGMFWSEGIVSMDLIADYNKDVPYKSAIKLKLNLSNVSNKNDLTGAPKFTYTDEGVVKASAVRITEGDHKDDFTVTLTGVKTGATEVTAEYNGYTARLMVTVTDVLTVQRLDPITLTLKAPDTQTTEPTPPTYGPSEPATVTLKLVGRKGNPINAGKSNTKWVIDDSEIVEWETNADGTVKVNDDGSFTLTGIKPGTAELSVTATYTLDGKNYKAKGSLSVTVNEPKPPTTLPETGGGEGGGETG